MGATTIAAILTASECLFLYAGDCRLYQFRKEVEPFVTADHSVTRMLVESGRLAAEDAADHPMRSVVTSSLSASPKGRLRVDPKWDKTADQQPAFRDLLPGDLLLFCSDGLSSEVPLEVLRSMTSDPEAEASVIVQALVGAALEAGGKDNVTVAVVRVNPILSAMTPDAGAADRNKGRLNIQG
jgi:protein phosphatase